MSEEQWKGTQLLATIPCCNFFQVYCCCAQPDEYIINEQRLTIVKKDGYCCFQTMEEDNTKRENITDVDIKSEAPGMKVLCCGTATDTVTVRTVKESGSETKTLCLGGGQGKVVKQILIRD